MRKALTAFAVLACLLPCTQAFSQSTYATVSGTVTDSTGAVLPGVSVTGTNNATGVVTSVITNEAGVYTLSSLLPGVYTVSAELPGFQKQNYTNVQLGNADRVRLNFALQVATQAQSVEVTVAADTLLATSSSSVGEVLSQTRVQDLPTVSNNVLDLYRLMPGIRVNADGVSGSFAGLSGFGTVNMLRDGVDAAGGSRWGSECALGDIHESRSDRRSPPDRRAGRCRIGPRQCADSIPDALRNQPVSRNRRVVCP